MKTAACYIRVSTDDQVEYSPDSQLREMRQYAERAGIVILADHIYVDEGISGRTADKRPQFQKMIALAKSDPKPFDIVLVYKFSRFARNREDSVVYKSVLRKKCGVDVVSIKEPLDTDNKMSGVMEAIIESMDEYYSANLSEDVRRTMTEKARRGELQTTPSFGYAVKDNVLVPQPDEAAIVREIYERFIGGEGYTAIAQSLNDRGIRTHRGNRFENRTVEYILRNPVYIGMIKWTPTGRTRREWEHPDTMYVQGKHEPIVSADTFDAAQARVRALKAQWGVYRKPSTSHKHWLSGLLRCAACGCSLVVGGEYFRCNGYAHGKCRHSQSVPIREIETLIIDQIKRDISHNHKLPVTVIDTARPDRSEELRQLIKRTDTRLSRAKELYLDGVEDLAAYKMTKAAIGNERAGYAAELRQIENGAADKRYQADTRNGLRDALCVLTDATRTQAEKYDAAHNIVLQGVVDREKGELLISYKLTL